MICRRLIAERVETSELVASEGAAVSLYLEADRVRTPKLRTNFCDIDKMEVGEIIHLKQKDWGLFRFLLASSLRAWWMKLTVPKDVIDADYEPAEERHIIIVDTEKKKEDRPAA